MIHYVSSNGVGQPWVANELSVMSANGIPFRLHAMRAPTEVHFKSEAVAAMARASNVLYPVRPLRALLSVLGNDRFQLVESGFATVIGLETGDALQILDHRVQCRVRVIGRTLIAHFGMSVSFDTLGEFAHEPALAKPGLAFHKHDLAFAVLGVGPSVQQYCKFGITSDEWDQTLRARFETPFGTSQSGDS